VTQSQQDFYNCSYPELVEILERDFAASKFRATQLFEWVYRKGVTDFSQMTNIGRDLRARLEQGFCFPRATVHDRQISQDGTRKYLFEVDGGDLVEAVMIKQASRMTLCVSSQVGCAMACGFCRTGTMGLKRSLSTSEILQQVNGVIEDAKSFGDSFSNIVFMGMGEPLHNFDNVARAVRNLTNSIGYAMSPRKVTVSTSGLVPEIRRLVEEKVNVSLAVSLNASSDEVRTQVMPVNKRWPIKELLAAVRDFAQGTRKTVTIEYVMLGGLNDTRDDMKRLVRLLHGLPVKVNLIPYNDNAGLGFNSPTRDWVFEWQRHLNQHGLQAFIRWSKGADIAAACGQLATASKRQRPSRLPVLAGEAQAAA